ncbi:IlvGEDA operon leader peptide [Enterobacteriaceae bacterium ESL0689]|nr:IlvGEDA operon leader peptide [Enterobacteriaceae bacterium ESL0689]
MTVVLRVISLIILSLVVIIIPSSGAAPGAEKA